MKAIGLVAENFEKLTITRYTEQNDDGYRVTDESTEEIKGVIMTNTGNINVTDSDVDPTGRGILYTQSNLKPGVDVEDESGRKWNVISENFANAELDVKKYNLERM